MEKAVYSAATYLKRQRREMYVPRTDDENDNRRYIINLWSLEWFDWCRKRAV